MTTTEGLPEDTNERRMFDSMVNTLGSSMAVVAQSLTIMSQMAPKHGSYAMQLAIYANECRKADAALVSPTSTTARIEAAARVFCNGLPLESHARANTLEGQIAKGRCWAPDCPCWEQGKELTRAALAAADRLSLTTGRLPPVERIDMVSYESGFEEPAEPMWRVTVGEYCTDFETETAANNFHGAIKALAAADRVAGEEVREALIALLAHDYAEECQECAIGRSEAWKNAKAALARSPGKGEG